MVDGLHPGSLDEGAVPQEDGLGETGGAGGIVDGGLILVVNEDLGGHAGAVGRGPVVVLGEGGAAVPHEEEEPLPAQVVGDVLHPADELGSEEEHVGVGQLHAVVDLLRRVAEVQGNGHRPRLQNAEVDGQPLQAVHQQDGHLLALPDAPAPEQIGHPVGLLVKDRPGDLPAVGGGGGGLDEGVLLPGHPLLLMDLGVDLHQGDLVPVELAVALQQVGNGHVGTFLSTAAGPPVVFPFNPLKYHS